MSNVLMPKYGKNKIANVLLKYNYQVKKGDILAGTIIGKERKEILIDLGLKQASFLPNNEIYIHLNTNPTKILKINEFGEFIIIYYNFKTNLTIVSPFYAETNSNRLEINILEETDTYQEVEVIYGDKKKRKRITKLLPKNFATFIYAAIQKPARLNA